MILRLLAAFTAFILSVTHAHITASVGGVPVSVSVPWVIVAVAAAGLAVFAVLLVRHLRNFRSSPFPRTRFAT